MDDKRGFWEGHIQAWQASGSTQAHYCREHQLALASFGYWRRKLKAAKPSAAKGLIPILGPAVANRPVIEIALGSGLTLRIPPEVQASQVAAWVQALRAC